MALSMQRRAGTQREFETIFILRPDTNRDGIQLVNTRQRRDRAARGSSDQARQLGKRKLAYEVKKQLKGIYLYWQYLGTTGVVERSSATCACSIRSSATTPCKVDENVDPTAKPARSTTDIQQGGEHGSG
jgi:small subunit ribosomal protein S6